MFQNRDKLLFYFLLAVFLAVLFSRITFTGFDKFRENITKSDVRPVQNLVSLRFDENSKDAKGVLLLSLRIKNTDQRAKSLEIFLNAVKIADLGLPSQDVQDYFLEVGKENLSRPENSLEIKGSDDAWELKSLEIKNIYGYSSGMVRLIVIPKATDAYLRPAPSSLGLSFFLILLLGIAQALAVKNLPAKKPVRNLDQILRLILISLFVISAVLPFISKYRILFAFRNLWVFIPFLYFSLTLSGLKILVSFLLKGFRSLKKFLSNQDTQSVGWKRHLPALAISCLIFVFFLLLLAGMLKFFQGDYSRFMCFSDKFVSNYNPVFWNKSPQLLFENSDFEKGTLENWTASGNAFLFQPTRDDNVVARGRRLPVNHQGKYWIGTFEKYQGQDGEIPGTIQGDRPSGTLISRPFVIQKDKIGFLIGGGEAFSDINLSEQAVALEINGETVLKETGKNIEMMDMHVWDVKPWVGEMARIVIEDAASRNLFYRHINADWFHYYRDDGIKEKLFRGISDYDGQFYYFMAYDPFLNRFKDNPRKYRLMLDSPPYRYGRIGFSLLTKIFSLDQPQLYPRTMMLLILFSHFFGAFFLVKIIHFFQQSIFWAFLYILIPGFLSSLHYALPESIATAFLLAGFYFFLKEKPWVSASLLACSFLIRETGAILALAIILFELFKKKNFKNTMILGLSFIPVLAWRCFLTMRLFPEYGWETFFYSPNDFSFPFSGFVELYKKILGNEYIKNLIPSAAFYPVILTGIFLFSLYFLWTRRDSLGLAFFLFSLIAVLLNYEKIWVHIDNGVRGTYEAFLFLIIAFATYRGRRKPVVKYLILGLFLLIFVYDFFLAPLHLFFREGFVIF